MLSDKQQIIQNATKQYILFPAVDNKGKKPITIWKSDLILPSSYSFRSSQQIEHNTQTIQQIAHLSSIQTIKNISIPSQHNWPQSSIGLVLCEHHQNNLISYVYGTGILIHNKIVLTNAQNLYCRRLQKEYINIKFITGVSGNKCSGIYDVMRVHYPMQYTRQLGYENYDFAVLQLYDDLSKSCGYLGWKTDYNQKSKEASLYRFISSNKQGFFNLRQLKKNDKLQQNEQDFIISEELLKQDNQYYVVGLYMLQISRYNTLNQVMRNMINQWTKQLILNLYNQKFLKSYQIVKYTTSDLRQLILWENQIDVVGCKNMRQANWTCLTSIDLHCNNIMTEGCKFLSNKWTHLTNIDLHCNNIMAEGCKYLSQFNWKHLTNINLCWNNIGAQGCKYLSEANWPRLTSINLYNNNIGAQGCKYLSEANWPHLTQINLYYNNIEALGCKYLAQTNWPHLSFINLNANNIGTKGCKHLNEANWQQLNTISLSLSQISKQGCKFLSQTNWKDLAHIDLSYNKIDAQALKYLSQVKWTHLSNINLKYNRIYKIIDKIILKELWCWKITF